MGDEAAGVPGTARLGAPRDTVRAGYLSSAAGQVYCLHESAQQATRAAVLLCGPLASERAYSYNVWARWGRHLALDGLDVLRFDYVGTGESPATGSPSWHSWVQDARICLRHLQAVSGDVPTVVHGLRFGALVAATLFADGDADMQLLWDPPASGQTVLDELLRRQAAEQAALGLGRPAAPGRGQQAAPACVDGLPLSAAACRELAQVRLPALDAGESRPHLALRLVPGGARKTAAAGADAVRIPAPGFWRPSRLLTPPLDELFDRSRRWICSQLPR